MVPRSGALGKHGDFLSGPQFLECELCQAIEIIKVLEARRPDLGPFCFSPETGSGSLSDLLEFDCCSGEQFTLNKMAFATENKSFPGVSDGKESAYNAGSVGSIPKSERSPGEGNGNLAWKITWTEIPGELLFVVSQSDVTEATNTHTRSLDGPQRVGPVMNSRSRACYESLPMGVFS